MDFDDVLLPHLEARTVVDAMVGSIVHALDTDLKVKNHSYPGSRKDMASEVLESWNVHRLGTHTIAERYGLDKIGLHYDYHRHFIDGYVRNNFKKYAGGYGTFYPDIRLSMQQAYEHGTRFSVLTHGCQIMAKEICDEQGLTPYIDYFDSNALHDFITKCKNPELYRNHLRRAGYAGPVSDAQLVDDNRANITCAVREAGLRGAWITGARGIGMAQNTMQVMRDIARESVLSSQPSFN